MRIYYRIMSSMKKPYGSRKFYQLPEDYSFRSFKPANSLENEQVLKLLNYIDENVIGRHQTFAGPYGRRKVVYCDYTASARSLSFIEDYILNEVLPYYGNTHTTTTITSMQSTLFRHESRDIIRNAVNASERDVVVFTGHGCTGAVHKLIHALNLQSPPIIFVGPSEHHSNLLPWRELQSKIVRISETKEGILDLVDLENQLRAHQGLEGNPSLIGCFSAASNITGILVDDIATTLLLHQYGALAFWDYATAAPYIQLDMNPFIPGIQEKAAFKDAMFFSGHKFVGGVQTPGVLIAKKSLFNNPVPQGCGGGTVFFVTRKDHRYLKDAELREEGGTAAIVESIRIGLAFQLKQTVGASSIMSREEEIVKMVLSHIRTIPEIILLGSNSQTVKRLAVFSFMVRHPRGMFLHHNFICSVLNDMFGIQARGGCACAGPYAQDLLGIDQELAEKYEAVLLEDSRLDRHHLRRKEEHSNYEMLRPGFTRVSLPFFMQDSEIAFVLEALKMVATEGWKLLPQYILNPETGEWRHHTNLVFRERKWLGAVNYIDGKMTVNERRVSGITPCPKDYAECLQIARNTFNKARKMAQRYPLADQCVMFDGELSSLRWFMLPSEAQDLLLGHSHSVKQDVPFHPISYSGSKNSHPPFGRHNSLPVLDTNNSCNSRELKAVRQRSDSQSPARNRISPLVAQHSRERCYSLGSTFITELTHSPELRHELVSCGSQTDVTENDLCFAGDSEMKGLASTSLLSANSPEQLHAYVQGVTEELATEIKSELREVIAQVQDVLSDSGDTDPNSLMEKRSSLDLQKRTENSFQGACGTPNRHPEIVHQDGIFADQITEYLAELTTEMVSEMKSELREMVNAVDEIISPSSEISKPFPTTLDQENNGKLNLSKDKEMNSYHFKIECGVKKKINGGIEDLKLNSCSPCTSIFQSNDGRSTNSESSVNGLEKSTVNGGGTLTDYLSDSKITSDSNIKLPKPQWCCPPKNIWKPANEAIKEFDMIHHGDRILVCLSGGKDSLSLLHTLHQYQHYAASKGLHFDLGAATVDPESSAYDPKPLIPYLKALGVEYFYETQPILKQAANSECKSVCSFCSRMKRGRLYSIARRNNYNVLALGQHLDDLAESFLMSTFHNGRLRSMKAHYFIRERDLRVIRPFVYVRERSLRQFAEGRNLPVIPENCPACFQAPKERYRMKQLLAQQEILFPRLFLSLRTAIKPIISMRYTGQESALMKMIPPTSFFNIVESDEDE